MVLLENISQAISIRVAESDAGVAQVVGKIVFADHLAAVGAVSALFMLDKRDFQGGGCGVAVCIFIVDGTEVVGALCDGEECLAWKVVRFLGS